MPEAWPGRGALQPLTFAAWVASGLVVVPVGRRLRKAQRQLKQRRVQRLLFHFCTPGALSRPDLALAYPVQGKAGIFHAGYDVGLVEGVWRPCLRRFSGGLWLCFSTSCCLAS